jgi:DNA-3-methyladenine glycosylase II
VFVAIPEPFDFSQTIARVAALGADRVNVIDGERLLRAFAGRAVSACPVAGGVSVDQGGLAEARMFSHVFGATFDLVGFERHASSDAVLDRLITSLRGMRPFLVPDPFEMIVSAITAQQISLHAALAVRNRFVERFGQKHGPVYAFPSAARVVDAQVSELRDLGFSRSKARFVLEIAGSDVDLADLAGLSDEDVVETLTDLPGVGRWTAEWFLARHLGREDVWPAGDLAVRRALERFYTDGEPVDETRARELGERFAPNRTLACAYLLAGLKLNPK